MSPRKTSPSGSFRFNRDFTRLGVGVIQRASRTDSLKEFRRRDAVLTKLAEASQVEILRAFNEGRLSIEQLVDADRQNKLNSPHLASELALRENLWDAINRVLPKMGRSDGTRARYATSFAKFRRLFPLSTSDSATVRDLSRIAWNDLEANWGGSAADWNHLRRALSAFLTQFLDDKYHPHRREVLKRFPRRSEVERVSQLTVSQFWAIIEAAPANVRASFVTLAATGMRVGEYLACTKAHLRPELHAIVVPGSKTAESSATIYVDARLWRWIEEGIPSPHQYKRLREKWVHAAKHVGASGVRIHDIRHLYAQLGTDEGVPEVKVQAAMRHATASMTRRYSRQHSRGEVATAVCDALLRSAK